VIVPVPRMNSTWHRTSNIGAIDAKPGSGAWGPRSELDDEV
jgi:hypothetical protein